LPASLLLLPLFPFAANPSWLKEAEFPWLKEEFEFVEGIMFDESAVKVLPRWLCSEFVAANQCCL
jgi:hypothetical protein